MPYNEDRSAAVARVRTEYAGATSISRMAANSSILKDSSLTALHCATLEAAPQCGGVMVSTGLLVAERHAGVWTPVIAHKTISAEPQFALAA